MALDINTQKLKSPLRRGVLPDPFYYLNNFQTVLSSLETRYTELLSPEERQFIGSFRTLARASRALLVRMVMRQSAFIRASRLKYPEIGDTSSAVEPLVDKGWVDESPDMDVDELQRLLTKAELLDHFALSPAYRKLRKSELSAILRAQYSESRPFHTWCRGSIDRVYHLISRPLCERFRLIFFGNFHQDWTDFVLTDLGLFAYEKIPAALQSPAFRTRTHIDAFQQLYLCRQSFLADMPLDHVIAAIPAPITDSEWLEDHRQKLLFQIARAYERQGNRPAARAIYMTCTHRGARLRRIRLHERACEWKAAHDLCLTAQQNPENEAERQQLRRLSPRLSRKLGIEKTETFSMPDVPTFEMLVEIPRNDYVLEHYVRDRLAQSAEAHSTIHYVENGLVNSLFGLLCWKAIFAPIPGAFFHDFQYGPADLASGEFVERRRSQFADCFAQLESDRYQATIRECFAGKSGVQCPFIAWGLLSERLLESAMSCFPAPHLRLWFEWILRDVQENRAGFPDLVQFWPRERRYRLVEVKGPGDQLRDNQRRLLEYCVSHNMPVSVCRVRWAPS
jgi:hypothetical protein